MSEQMGLDLTLLPLRGPQQLSDTSVICYDRLSFERDYDIFCQLTDVGGNKPKIRVNPLPPQLWVEVYEDEGIKQRRDDDYGIGLTFVYARQLKNLRVSDNTSPKNRAVKAFVEALPDDTPIILLWR